MVYSFRRKQTGSRLAAGDQFRQVCRDALLCDGRGRPATSFPSHSSPAHRLYGVSALLLIAVGHAAPVFAQAPEDVPERQGLQENEGRDVVVVTAQKREENIQDIPIAINAFTDTELERLGVQGAEGLAAVVPNLQFGTSDVNSRVAIRGIGAGDTNFAADPGVAFHIDGIYQTRTSGPSSAAFFDVARIEVLRGPQGTLYGRNATGGAVNVISNLPADTFEAYTELLYGSFDRVRVRGFVNVPLLPNLSTRLTAEYDKAGGHTDNLIGPDPNDKDNLYVRGQLRFQPLDGHELVGRVAYAQRGGLGSSAVVIEPLDNRPGNLIIGGGATPAQVQAASGNLANRYATAQPNASLIDPYTARFDSPFEQDTTTTSLSLDYTADLGFADLKVLAGYQDGDEFNLEDSDRTELFIATRSTDRKYTQQSLELTLGSSVAGVLDWIVGAFYMEDEVTQYLLSRNSPSPTAIPLIRDDAFAGDTFAGFGQASFNVTGDLKATAGVRYTVDRKSGSQFGQNFNGAIRNAFETGEWEEPTYRVGLDYKLPGDGLLYGSYSRGYKAGGFRFLPTVGAVDPDGTYRPEFVNAIEFGSKTTHFDGAVQANAAIFNYDYTDLQFVEIRDQQQIVSNIGEAQISGVELELSILPDEFWNIDLSAAYLDAEINKFVGPDPRFGPLNPAAPVLSNPANINPNVGFPIDVSGNQLPQSPELSVRFGVSRTVDLPSGATLTPQVRLNWQSKMYFTPFNSAVEAQGAFVKGNLSVIYRSADDRMTIEAFVNNIGNIATRSFVFNGSATTGTLYQGTYAEPRTWGVRIGHDF